MIDILVVFLNTGFGLLAKMPNDSFKTFPINICLFLLSIKGYDPQYAEYVTDNDRILVNFTQFY